MNDTDDFICDEFKEVKMKNEKLVRSCNEKKSLNYADVFNCFE
jgi:hypothetical protein